MLLNVKIFLINIMAIIGGQNLNLSPKGNGWDIVDFTLVNPTSSPVTFNLFDVNNPVPIPTSTSGWFSYPNTPSTPISIFGARNVAYSIVNNTLYVVGSGTVTVIDCSTNAIITTVVISGGVGVANNIIYNSSDNTMYVSGNFSSGDIDVIDCSTNTVIATISTTSGNALLATYNPLQNTMYFTESTLFIVVDCNTNTVIYTTTLGFSSYGIAYNSYNNSLYISDGGTDVNVINCVTNTVSATITGVGTAMEYVEYNNLNNTIYVTDSTSNTVVVINCVTNSVVATVPVGTQATSLTYIKYDSINNLMYVSNFTSKNIYIIDCSTNTVTAPVIALTTAPFALGYNSFSNSMYVIQNAITVPLTSDLPPVYIESNGFSYNQFVKDLSVNPKRMKQMVLITSNSQLAKPLNFKYTNMIGVSYVSPRHPNLNISQYMPQSTISAIDLNPDELESEMSEHTLISQYTILPYTRIDMVLYCKEMSRDNLLNIVRKTELNHCSGMSVANCNENIGDKNSASIENFGEPVLTMDEIINNTTNG